MNCHECRDLLSPLLDRELDEETLERLQTHLTECSSCCRDCALLLSQDAAADLSAVPELQKEGWGRVWAAVEGVLPAAEGVTQAHMEPAPSGSEVLTTEEAARYLRLTLETLLSTLDTLPHFRIGEEVRFRRGSLDGWIAAQEQWASKNAPEVSTRRTGTDGNVIDFVQARSRLSRLGRI